MAPIFHIPDQRMGSQMSGIESTDFFWQSVTEGHGISSIT